MFLLIILIICTGSSSSGEGRFVTDTPVSNINTTTGYLTEAKDHTLSYTATHAISTTTLKIAGEENHDTNPTYSALSYSHLTNTKISTIHTTIIISNGYRYQI